MDKIHIQSSGEHKEQIKRLWTICIILASLIFLATGSATLLMLFWFKVDPPAVLVASTLFFQILVVSYGMGFFVPAFLTSLTKLSLSIQMGRESLRMGQETVEAMKDVQGNLKPILDDLKDVVEKTQPVVDKMNEAVQKGILEKVEGHLEAIRKRIDKDTQPLPVRRREEKTEIMAAPGGDGQG